MVQEIHILNSLYNSLMSWASKVFTSNGNTLAGLNSCEFRTTHKLCMELTPLLIPSARSVWSFDKVVSVRSTHLTIYLLYTWFVIEDICARLRIVRISFILPVMCHHNLADSDTSCGKWYPKKCTLILVSGCISTGVLMAGTILILRWDSIT